MTLKNFLSLRLCQAEAAAGENRPARLRGVRLDRLMLGLKALSYILEYFLSNHRDQKGW